MCSGTAKYLILYMRINSQFGIQMKVLSFVTVSPQPKLFCNPYIMPYIVNRINFFSYVYIPVVLRAWPCEYPMGLFTKEWITFPKPFGIVILTLCLFESLILPFVNAKLFQIRLLKRKKGAFWIMIHLESLILRTWERKALSECDSCVHIWKCALKPCMGQSVQ